MAYSEQKDSGAGFTYRTRAGDVLDLVCLRVYRRDGMMDVVNEANTHLHGLPCVLPIGVEIWFPPLGALPLLPSNGGKAVVTLWG